MFLSIFSKNKTNFFRDKTAIYLNDENKSQVLSGRARGPPRSFNFDHVFWQDTSQYEIYEAMGEPLVDSLLAGFNICLFGYGQTGELPYKPFFYFLARNF